MKCKKCGYTSFDYNQVCPKCNKDIIIEQENINLPFFKPSPPSLLGVLTGEANDSNVDIKVGSPLMEASDGIDVSLDDSSEIEAGELGFEEKSEIDTSIEPDESGEIAISDEPDIAPDEDLSDLDLEGEEKISFDTDEITMGDIEEVPSPVELKDEAEINLDLSDLSVEEPEQEMISPEEMSQEEAELDIDLDDLSIDDSGAFDEIEADELVDKTEESGLSPDSFSTEGDITAKDREESDIELNMDDLGAGEIDQISTEAVSPEKTEEPIEIEELSVDRSTLEDTKELLDVEEFSFDEPASETNEEPLDIETISLDEPIVKEKEELAAVVESSLDESAVKEEVISDDKQAESEEIEIDLDAIPLDEEEGLEGARDGEEFTLDLENLDLDIDLEEPGDKI